MAVDWSADVRKYAPGAADAVIAGIVRYCGIALRNRDSALVSFSDKAETDRVRKNFLKKKLQLTEGDAVLDAAIAAVAEQMKADKSKNRVTVYYLLADRFGKLDLFAGKTTGPEKTAPGKAPPAPAKAAVKAAPAKPGAKAATKPATAKPAPAAKTRATPTKTAAAKSKPAPKVAPTPAPPLEAKTPSAPASVPEAAAPSAAKLGLASPQGTAPGTAEPESGFGWVWWLLAALLVLFGLWWFVLR
ncbi:MAG: DUF2853 family protein [Novosphingobium sp.]|jgi:hypothetical protein